MTDDLRSTPFVVWSDYGMEGWKPEGFEELSDALDFVAAGGHGVPMCLTERLELYAQSAGPLGTTRKMMGEVK